MLRKTALFAIIGIFYLFLLRTVGTFCQQMFRENLLLVQITKALAFLAILTLVFFFVSFLKYSLGKKETELKNATVFVLIGYILMTVNFSLSLRNYSSIYPFDISRAERYYLVKLTGEVFGVTVLPPFPIYVN